MGGHGALTIALKNPLLFKSVSAFAPICNPKQCPWGQKVITLPYFTPPYHHLPYHITTFSLIHTFPLHTISSTGLGKLSNPISHTLSRTPSHIHLPLCALPTPSHTPSHRHSLPFPPPPLSSTGLGKLSLQPTRSRQLRRLRTHHSSW